MIKIYIMLIVSILISPVAAEENQSINNSTYRVLVDQYNGFYAVYQIHNVTLPKTIPYENRTFNISKGDTVIWSNEAVPDIKLSIGNKENLWDKYNGTLKWSYKQFIFTFNKSGIYEIYVREYPRFKQKIIVGPIEIKNNTNKTITNKTVNNTVINKPNLTVNKSTNVSKNDSMPVAVPIEKKQGTEVAVLVTVTLSLIYIFDRKIK